MDTKTRIAEIGEQLEVSETKCESIKSQLGYMKMLYYKGIPSDPIEAKSKDYLDDDFYPVSQSIVQNQCQPVSKDFQEFLNQQNSRVRNFKNEINKFHSEIEETIAETERTNSKKSIKSLMTELENRKEDEEIKRNWNYGSISPRTIVLSTLKENEIFTDEDNNEVLKISLSRHSNQINSLPKNTRNHSNEIWISTENKEPAMKKMEIKEEIEDLKFSESMESARKSKKRKSNKSEKRHKSGNKSLTRMDENFTTIVKVKKKKGRLRSISSKSTIATKKDSNLIERKERKRRKQKNFIQKNIRSSNLQNPETKIEKSLNDIVELYHNVALKNGSMSLISSKHSRLNPHFPESIHQISSSNSKKVEYKKPEIKHSEKSAIVEDINSEKSKEENIENESGAKYLYSYPGNKFYDPILMRNYEQPTVSSKLKRVQRSYYNRFNFRNIPFIVGTSISPSHNLGLNIQQVLSIMKNKQAKPQGITSMLIRKMSQGNEMDSQIGLNFNKVCLKNSSLNCQTSQISSANRIPNLQKKFCPKQSFSRNTCETLFEEKEMELNMENKNQTSLQTRNDAKGNRDVLIKLHDQFEEMNSRYEKLQDKAEKTKDKSLTKEIEKLELDLTAKEEEINSVVGLYKEVMFLKKQMKRMSEKNSFVCISPEASNPSPIINYAHNPMIRSYFSPHLQMSKNRGNSYGNSRKPSTGTRLTGLLRQIQMFQWQLRQAS